MPKTKRKPDYWILITVFMLTILGLVMLASATIVEGNKLGDPYLYVRRQLIQGILFGSIGMLIMSRIPYTFLKKHALWIMLSAITLLIMILTPWFGSTSGTGAQRWISIFGFHVQPGEYVKIAFISYMAAWLDQRGDDVKNFGKGVIPFLIFTGVVSFLILAQPNASLMGLLLMTALVVFFVSGARISHILLLLTIGALLAVVTLTQASYRLDRLKCYTDPSHDPEGLCYQVNQSAIAIGSGGIWGLGLGHSKQKYNYLPEVQNDTIFAILGEELGLIGVGVVISLFTFFAYRGIRISEHAEDRFGSILAIGITFLIVMQAFINMGAISGLFPLTGIPLPFISFGSSSLVISLASIGILFSISRGVRK